jgi:hypothetical protein
LKLKQSIIRRWLSSGLLRRVDWWTFTDVSEVIAVFIIIIISGKLLTDYAAQQPRRQSSRSPS